MFPLLQSQCFLKMQVYSTDQLTPPFPVSFVIILVEYYLRMQSSCVHLVCGKYCTELGLGTP